MPGGWELLHACRAPERAQAALLKRIVAHNRTTEFARLHALGAGTSVEEYRRRVPIRRYVDFKPWLDRMVHGERDVLVKDPVVLFARTSGTTTEPKYIPVTHEGVRSFQWLAGLWASLALHDVPAAGRGRILVLTSTAAEELPSGIPAGTTTHPRKTPANLLGGRLLAVPPSFHTPPDFEERRYKQLLFALGHDLSLIGVTAPTTLIVMFERLRAWGRELVDELAQGPLRAPDLGPPDETLWRARVEHLRRVLARDGELTPRTAWPLLSLMASFVEGPSRIYLPRLSSLTDGLAHRNAGYAASEGRFAVPLTADASGGVLALSHYFFEFAEERDDGANTPLTLLPAELELGKRYRPVVTTSSGLYRYDMEDTVEVVGFYERAPTIAFCHRQGMVVMAGENMTELQVVEAVRRAAAHVSASLVDFVAQPCWEPPAPGYYHFLVELAPQGSTTAGLHESLARAIEDALCAVNREYVGKRGWARLGPPRVVLATPGTFEALRRRRLALGASESRYKHRHLLTDVCVGRAPFDDWLATISTSAATQRRSSS
jgi:hypothetical protein